MRIQAYAPQQSMKKEVAKIFNAPKLSEWLENSIPEGLQVFQIPEAHRVEIRTINLAERINREIKRRTLVVSIFPNP